MSKEEAHEFLMEGSRTGKLATTRADGRPHVAPIWFTLDGDDLLFTTMKTSLKGRNLARDPRLMISVDSEEFPYAFVLIEGTAELENPSPEEMLHWATEIARRYVPEGQAEAFGRRNAVPEEVLVRVKVSKMNARKGVADW
jgi:PPOX class probable F420-dependent enzyme